MTYQELGRGIVKRSEKRVVGLFIDGTGLDRATRRLNRKVEMSLLVRGVTAGAQLAVARYYTIIPYEDDSRQRAFLDAVGRTGLQVVVKRLPPVGITRQVSIDVEMAADILAFSLGHQRFSALSAYQAASFAQPSLHNAAARDAVSRDTVSRDAVSRYTAARDIDEQEAAGAAAPAQKIKRVVTIVCPSRDLAYPISLAKELGVDTVNADFGEFAGQDVLKSAAKFIDLSGSETIWRDKPQNSKID